MLSNDLTSQDISEEVQVSQKKIKKWTPPEDSLLQQFVAEFGEKNWRQISNKMVNRTPIQCLHRWTKILKPGLVKGPWSQEEDEKLLEWVKTNGPQKWSLCSETIPGRSGKQCRERWFNNLNPNVKKGNWTQEEDDMIFKGYLTYGSSWSKISKDLEGRTENSVKNRFYSTVRKLFSDSQGNGGGLGNQGNKQGKSDKGGSKNQNAGGNDKEENDQLKNFLEKHLKQQQKQPKNTSVSSIKDEGIEQLGKKKGKVASKQKKQSCDNENGGDDDDKDNEGEDEQNGNKENIGEQRKLQQNKEKDVDDDDDIGESPVKKIKKQSEDQKKEEKEGERLEEKVKQDKSQIQQKSDNGEEEENNSNNIKNRKMSEKNIINEKIDEQGTEKKQQKKDIEEKATNNYNEEKGEKHDKIAEKIIQNLNDKIELEEEKEQHSKQEKNEKNTEEKMQQVDEQAIQVIEEEGDEDGEEQLEGKEKREDEEVDDEEEDEEGDDEDEVEEEEGEQEEGNNVTQNTDSSGSNLQKRKYSKKVQEDYSQQNLLYRLLKEKHVPIKKTTCMKDYSVFYRKYKQNKNSNKRKQKENEKLSSLKKYIEKSYGAGNSKQEDGALEDFNNQQPSTPAFPNHNFPPTNPSHLDLMSRTSPQFGQNKSHGNGNGNGNFINGNSKGGNNNYGVNMFDREMEKEVNSFFMQNLQEITKKFQNQFINPIVNKQSSNKKDKKKKKQSKKQKVDAEKKEEENDNDEEKEQNDQKYDDLEEDREKEEEEQEDLEEQILGFHDAKNQSLSPKEEAKLQYLRQQEMLLQQMFMYFQHWYQNYHFMGGQFQQHSMPPPPFPGFFYPGFYNQQQQNQQQQQQQQQHQSTFKIPHINPKLEEMSSSNDELGSIRNFLNPFNTASAQDLFANSPFDCNITKREDFLNTSRDSISKLIKPLVQNSKRGAGFSNSSDETLNSNPSNIINTSYQGKKSFTKTKKTKDLLIKQQQQQQQSYQEIGPGFGGSANDFQQQTQQKTQDPQQLLQQINMLKSMNAKNMGNSMDPKIMFLVQQLQNLEGILQSTKSELCRLEVSVQNPTPENRSVCSAPNISQSLAILAGKGTDNNNNNNIGSSNNFSINNFLVTGKTSGPKSNFGLSGTGPFRKNSGGTHSDFDKYIND